MMSGTVLTALASLLIQQAAPLPSSLEPYRAPAIRPFEPAPDFGRETGQGDEAPPPHRPPLNAPVAVDAYVRSYEFTPTDAEVAYEQGVAAAEIRTDQTAGPLDGLWLVRDAEGRTLFALAMSDVDGAPVEGGWRVNGRSGAATVADGTLTLEGVGAIRLERTSAGWRGLMAGRPVTLSRPD